MNAQTWTKIDSTLLEFEDENPHKEGTAAHAKYEKFKFSESVADAKSAGASAWDPAEYFKKGKLKVLERVPNKGGREGGKGWKNKEGKFGGGGGGGGGEGGNEGKSGGGNFGKTKGEGDNADEGNIKRGIGGGENGGGYGNWKEMGREGKGGGGEKESNRGRRKGRRGTTRGRKEI